MFIFFVAILRLDTEILKKVVFFWVHEAPYYVVALSHCCIAVVAKLNNCSMPSSASYTHTVNWVKFSGCKKQCVGVAK